MIQEIVLLLLDCIQNMYTKFIYHFQSSLNQNW